MTEDRLLVLDEGTSSTRAMVFDASLNELSRARRAVAMDAPEPGWAEQDAEAVWRLTVEAGREAVDAAGGAERLAGIAIANQRETAVCWSRRTGGALGPAISWQDRRTAEGCAALKAAGHEAAVRAATGLLLDPYFSGLKFAWALEHYVAGAGGADAAVGTVESWLIHKLTGGARHVTDAVNASRTSLARLTGGEEGAAPGAAWDDGLLDLFGVPRSALPEITACDGGLGEAEARWFGKALPILAAVGDQQAALLGHGALGPGAAKVTFGTGAFALASTGPARPRSAHRLLSTLAVSSDRAGASAFALEGSVFHAGTVVGWLVRLGLARDAADASALAEAAGDSKGAVLVPAFGGLGAPHWRTGVSGALGGLALDTGPGELLRAGFEAAVFQTADLLDAFRGDGAEVRELHVDGGLAAAGWLMQRLADLAGVEVVRPLYGEMTALGAARLAAKRLGWPEADRTGDADRFAPQLAEADREAAFQPWREALSRLL